MARAKRRVTAAVTADFLKLKLQTKGNQNVKQNAKQNNAFKKYVCPQLS